MIGLNLWHKPQQGRRGGGTLCEPNYASQGILSCGGRKRRWWRRRISAPVAPLPRLPIYFAVFTNWGRATDFGKILAQSSTQRTPCSVPQDSPGLH